MTRNRIRECHSGPTISTILIHDLQINHRCTNVTELDIESGGSYGRQSITKADEWVNLRNDLGIAELEHWDDDKKINRP